MRTDGKYFRMMETLALAVALALLSVGTARAAPFFLDEVEELEVFLCGEDPDPECEADCGERCQEAFGTCFFKPGTEGGPDRYCHYNHCDYIQGVPRKAKCTYYCYTTWPCPPE